MKTPSLARATVGALALSVLAGCNGTKTFTIEETLTINGSGPSVSTNVINLAEVADGAWDHRDKITSAKITACTAVVSKVYTGAEPPANETTSVTGSVSLTLGGETVVFASGTNVAVGLGAVYVVDDAALKGTASLIKKALKGDGMLEVSTDASPTAPATDATTHIDVKVLMDVEVEWSVSPF